MATVINALNRNSGKESLGIGERIELFMSEISTGITAMNVKAFSSSIHTVPVGTVFDKLKVKNNYFTLSTDFIPAPVFFDPNVLSFKDYVVLCTTITSALKVATDEVKTVYSGIKTAAATSNVPFSLRETSNEKMLSALSIKLDDVFQNTGKANRQLSVLYKSFTDAKETFKLYNDNIKSLSSRDPELLVKYTGDLTSLVKVLRSKIEKSDVIFDAAQIATLEMALTRVDKTVNATGRLLSMCNELTRVFELQLAYFNKHLD